MNGLEMDSIKLTSGMYSSTVTMGDLHLGVLKEPSQNSLALFFSLSPRPPSPAHYLPHPAGLPAGKQFPYDVPHLAYVSSGYGAARKASSSHD